MKEIKGFIERRDLEKIRGLSEWTIVCVCQRDFGEGFAKRIPITLKIDEPNQTAVCNEPNPVAAYFDQIQGLLNKMGELCDEGRGGNTEKREGSKRPSGIEMAD